MNDNIAGGKAIPQAAYDLYDRYCHGVIGRRAFLNNLRGYAVSGVTMSALLAALMPNYAKAQQVPPDDNRISSQRISYQSPNGAGEMGGLLAKPKGEGAYPGVLVIHENRGLNPYIEDVARRLAVEGYIALAPDALYPLGGYPGDDDTGRSMQSQRDSEEMLQDFIAGASHLKAMPQCTGKIGVVGFCFGGRMANQLAVQMPDLSASAPFYGGWPTSEQAKDLNAALMIHLAGRDSRVNGGWPDYEAALLKEGKTYSVHVYAGVNHGFHNDSTSRYDEAAAKLAWQRTLAFFETYLS